MRPPLDRAGNECRWDVRCKEAGVIQIEKMFSRANADSVERDAEKHMCEFPTSPMSYKSQENLCMNAGASGYSPVLPDV